MLINEKHLAEINSPVQTINARVELHSGSTLVQICTCADYLKNLNVERVGEGKFFGYGICHKLIVNFIDPNRELDLTNIDFMEVTFGVGGEFIYPFPTFHVLEVNRDETTNEINVVAFDRLYKAANYTVSDLELPSSYSISSFISACAALLNFSVKFENVEDTSAFSTIFPDAGGAMPNFDGTETLRQALDAVAEVTQTIYYLSGDWQLTFKRLDQDGAAVATINKNQYIELKSGANCALGAITHTTELGDSITATGATGGVTQYLRDNPFLELREDTGALLDKAIAIVDGMTINPFDCSWMGNYLLEIGDKIALITADDREIITYIVDDSITFDGTLGQYSRWEFISDEAETANNPTSLGEALNKTFARVDKVNKRIDLVASDTSANSSKIAALEITTESITSTVSDVQTRVETAQATAEGAQETADAAQSAASGAQETADTNAANLTNLTTRVTTAESSITQNAEAIELRATKEEVTTVDDKVTANTESIGALQVETESISATVESTVATTEAHSSLIGALLINTESISASIKSVETATQEQIDVLSENLETLSKETSLRMTEEDVQIAITSELSNGVSKVTTNTGFTFNDEGLTIDKADSEMKTSITEDGMTVYKNNEEVLTANNTGVNAVNLHATTYLIIGGNSRFENYVDDSGTMRTACFWIGN